MKKSSNCCRHEKKPKRCLFRRAQPLGRVRLLKEKMEGIHRNNESIPMTKGGHYPKNRKF